MLRSIRSFIGPAAWSLALCAAPAAAVDGVQEINQTCAAGPGCFPGDGPRFPVTILQPGSYRLTSNLTLPDENTSAIRVEASEVSIDLNGFAIVGVTTCAGLPVTCATTGTGNGVEIDDDGQRVGVSVRNGSIRGMGSRGVLLGALSSAEDLRVRESGVVGIEVGSHSAVRNCEVFSNRFRGIVASNSVVSGNTAVNNGLAGIEVGDCVVSGNMATLNQGLGISVGGHSTVIANTASNNWGHGIVAAGDSTLVDNTASNNARLGAPPFDGIACGARCNVRGNTATQNSGRGLSLGANSAYRENVLGDNALGGVSGGVNTGANHCTGPNVVAATCP